MLRLQPRQKNSQLMLFLSPILAILVTMILGAILLFMMGFDGLKGVSTIFFAPIANPVKWQDVLVKATPLIIIGVGLSVGFRANVWNIGAEGQFVFGALMATGVALMTWEMTGAWIMPSIILAGILGGMAYAAIPAFLKVKLGVSEILTSLMLSYVAIQLLYYLMVGPWKDPMGFNFPQTQLFSDDQILPIVVERTVIHAGVPIAIVLAVLFWLIMSKTLFGFEIRLAGEAPKAAGYAGFNAKRTVFVSLLVGGGLAGLAGTIEAIGTSGYMALEFPQGYGFTAIIVAFLGRLNPLGVIFAGLIMAITYVGSEMAQTGIGLPSAAANLFQATTLFLLLAFDVTSRYTLVWKGSKEVGGISV